MGRPRSGNTLSRRYVALDGDALSTLDDIQIAGNCRCGNQWRVKRAVCGAAVFGKDCGMTSSFGGIAPIQGFFRLRAALGAVGLVASLCIATTAVRADTSPALVDGRAAGNGGWQRNGAASPSAAHLSVDLVRDGDRLSGTVDLAGSPLADRGLVSGTVRRDRVRGAIHSPAGAPIASFSGTVSRSGMSGTYRDRTGETGTWSWSAP